MAVLTMHNAELIEIFYLNQIFFILDFLKLMCRGWLSSSCKF